MTLRLFKANMKEQANKSLKLLKNACEYTIKKGLSERWFNDIYENCEKKLNGQRKNQHNNKSSSSANHAYRFGYY